MNFKFDRFIESKNRCECILYLLWGHVWIFTFARFLSWFIQLTFKYVKQRSIFREEIIVHFILKDFCSIAFTWFYLLWRIIGFTIFIFFSGARILLLFACVDRQVSYCRQLCWRLIFANLFCGRHVTFWSIWIQLEFSCICLFIILDLFTH